MKIIFITGISFNVKEIVRPHSEEVTPERLQGICEHALEKRKFVTVLDTDGTLQIFNPANLITIEVEP